MKIFVAHASAFDFEKKLYEPLRALAASTGHEFVLPHERGGMWNTRHEIAKCDLFIADISIPSTGAGVELGWASAFSVPIILIQEKGSKAPSFAKYLSKTVIEYANSDELIERLKTELVFH